MNSELTPTKTLNDNSNLVPTSVDLVEEELRKLKPRVNHVYYNKENALWVKLVLEKIRAEKRSALFDTKACGVKLNTLYIRFTQGWRYLIKELGDKMALEMKRQCKIKFTESGKLVVAYCPSMEDARMPKMVDIVPETNDTQAPTDIFLSLQGQINELFSGNLDVISETISIKDEDIETLNNLLRDIIPDDLAEIKISNNNIKIIRK